MCGATTPCVNSGNTWANNTYYYGSAAPPDWWAYHQGDDYTWNGAGSTPSWTGTKSTLCLQANEDCSAAMGQDAGSTITLAPSNADYNYAAGTLP
jgi:hypothetical protein